MPETLHVNNALAYLLTPVDTDDTTIVLMTGEGAQFPAISSGDDKQFYITVEDKTRSVLEIMTCTARSVDSLTVVRAQQGTVATAFLAGTPVSNRITAGYLNGIEERLVESASSAESAETAAAAALAVAGAAAGGVDGAIAAADAATAAAGAATTQAAAAQTTANTALANAATADGKAVAAQTAAATADGKATAATTAANSASSAADTASGNASAALSTATSAQSTANTALANAATADGKAVAAQTAANAADTKATNAQTSATAATVAAGNATTAAGNATNAAAAATAAAEAAVQWGDGADKSVDRALVTTGDGTVDTVPTSVVTPVADRLYGTSPTGPGTTLWDFPAVSKRLYTEEVVKTVSGGNFGAIVVDGTTSMIRFNLTANGVFNTAITGMRPGARLLARFVQDATGGRTLTSTVTAVAPWTVGTDFSIRTGANQDTYAELIALENGNVKVKLLGWPSAA